MISTCQRHAAQNIRSSLQRRRSHDRKFSSTGSKLRCIDKFEKNEANSFAAMAGSTFRKILEARGLPSTTNNKGALDIVVRGSSRGADANVVVFTICETVAALGVDAQWLWVASKSNLADGPTAEAASMNSKSPAPPRLERYGWKFGW